MNFFSVVGISPLGAYHSLMYGRSMYFDISKAMQQFKWKPKYSNDAMFVESNEWYVRNREKVFKSDGNESHHKSPVKQGALALLQKVLYPDFKHT